MVGNERSHQETLTTHRELYLLNQPVFPKHLLQSASLEIKWQISNKPGLVTEATQG